MCQSYLLLCCSQSSRGPGHYMVWWISSLMFFFYFILEKRIVTSPQYIEIGILGSIQLWWHCWKKRWVAFIIICKSSTGPQCMFKVVLPGYRHGCFCWVPYFLSSLWALFARSQVINGYFSKDVSYNEALSVSTTWFKGGRQKVNVGKEG